MECHLFQWFPSESLNEQRILFPDMSCRNYGNSGGVLGSRTLVHVTKPILDATLRSGRAGELGCC